MADLTPLEPYLPSTAIAILTREKQTLDKLRGYDLEQLEAIHGIGPKWAREIRNAVAIIDTAPPADETPLEPDYESLDFLNAGVDAIADMQPDEPAEPTKTDAALEMALGYLDECDRHADVEILRGKIEGSGTAAVLETAIAILEGLRPGNLGKNLAQDVREAAGS